MRIMVVGSGGREHALTWKIAQSPLVEHIICAPGNGGIASEPKTTCVPIQAEDLDGIVRLAQEQKIDLVVVGPEAPLCAGLVDRLSQAGILSLGPKAAGAKLEGSKVFAKDMMHRYGVPTADYKVFDDPQQALQFVRDNPQPWVIKADGLAAGKGVIPATNLAQAESAIQKIMLEKRYGASGERVVIEKFLEGEEVSAIALTDGKQIVFCASSQDHKRALDGDQGLNTGGMGAYSPAPVLTAALEQEILEKVFKPMVWGLAQEGIDFRGVLYAGLMIGSSGPMVLEFNVRFGDPECQPLMLRLKSDLVPVLHAVARGELKAQPLKWDPRPAVCVVLASGGYPESYKKGEVIEGLAALEPMQDVVVIHAGTEQKQNKIVTAGGRVLGVCALGTDIRQAVDKSYTAIERISFRDMQYRRDIAYRALQRLS